MSLSAGEIAGLVAAFAFVLLVGVTAIPLWKLGRVFDQARISLKQVTDETLPLVDEVTTTVAQTNSQLAKVDTITTNVAAASTNVTALSALFAATLGGPLIRVAAFSHGVRKAIEDRRRPGPRLAPAPPAPRTGSTRAGSRSDVA